MTGSGSLLISSGGTRIPLSSIGDVPDGSAGGAGSGFGAGPVSLGRDGLVLGGKNMPGTSGCGTGSGLKRYSRRQSTTDLSSAAESVRTAGLLPSAVVTSCCPGTSFTRTGTVTSALPFNKVTRDGAGGC